MAADPDRRIELLGAWESYASRWAELTLRVTSRKKTGASSYKDETAEYRLGPSPALGEDDLVLDVWDFHKTLPSEEDHQVALHKDGRLTCTCKHMQYARPGDHPPLCVHASAVLTLARRFEKVLLPLPAAGG